MMISFIIPAFNSEKYIARCLGSFYENLTISIDLFEVIVINDGSIDKTAEIVLEYQKKYANVNLITKENGGVSSARNLGLTSAIGKYIFFVDSDDVIHPNLLSQMLAIRHNTSVELIIFESTISGGDDPANTKFLYPLPDVVSGKIKSGIDLFKTGFIRGSVCGVGFNRSFLKRHNIKFVEQIRNGEDSLFMTMCIIYSKTVLCIKSSVYIVNETIGSASRLWNIEKVLDLMKSLRFIDQYVRRHNLDKDQLAMLNIKAYSIISNSLYFYSRLPKRNRYRELKSFCLESGIYPINLYGHKHFLYKIQLLNISFDLFYLFIFFKSRFLSKH